MGCQAGVVKADIDGTRTQLAFGQIRNLTWTQTSWFNQLLLVIIMALVKLSLLISYLRFFTQPLFRGLTWAMVALIVSWALGKDNEIASLEALNN